MIRGGIGIAVLCALLILGAASHAGTVSADGDAEPPGNWQLAVGPVAGVLGFDQDLTNYRWDTSPGTLSGLGATLYHKRFAAGVQVWRAHTTQETGISGLNLAPRVNLTGADILGRVRAMTYRNIELWGAARGGRLHLGYDPDQVTFDAGTGGSITVDYDPITEWGFGLGVELRSELTKQMAVSLQAERSTFALDTAHRRGDEIVQSRDRFFTWSVQLQISWLLNLG